MSDTNEKQAMINKSSTAIVGYLPRKFGIRQKFGIDIVLQQKFGIRQNFVISQRKSLAEDKFCHQPKKKNRSKILPIAKKGTNKKCIHFVRIFRY